MDGDALSTPPLILHANVQGFKNKRAEILHYIDETTPLVICLSELKLKSAPRIREFYSYKPTFPSRPYQGGSAVYVHSSLDSMLIDHVWNNGIEVIAVRVKFPRRHINIVHAYFPPYHHDSTPSLEDLDFISNLHGPTLLIGDLNAHHPDLGDPPNYTNQRGEAISDFLLNSHFQILNDDSHTYHNDRTGASSRLDLAIGNLALLDLFPSFSQGADLGSDHLPIHVTLDIRAPSRSNFVREVYDFKNANWVEFRAILDSLLPDTLALGTPSLLDDSATIVAEAILSYKTWPSPRSLVALDVLTPSLLLH